MYHSLPHHQASDDDQCTSRCPSWNGREDGGEEHAHEEHDSGHNGCDTRLPALRDTSSGLDERGDGGSTHERTH